MSLSHYTLNKLTVEMEHWLPPFCFLSYSSLHTYAKSSHF